MVATSKHPVPILRAFSYVGFSSKSAEVKPAGLRINKCFPQLSRTEVDRMIEDNRVFLNDFPAKLGARLVKGDKLRFDDRIVDWEKFAEKRLLSPYPDGLHKDNSFMYLKYYKGEDCNITTSMNDPDGFLRLDHFNDVQIDDTNRLLPVGRLDRMTTGLLIVTSDARLPSWLLGANTGCSKV